MVTEEEDEHDETTDAKQKALVSVQWDRRIRNQTPFSFKLRS